MFNRLFRRGGGGRGGRMGGNKPGAGPGGECVCPQCGHRRPHRIGVPCNTIKCDKCGTLMLRS